jgi:SAM-dependent methyltransferase
LSLDNDIKYWKLDSIWGSAENMPLHRGMEWLLRKWLLRKGIEALSDKKVLSGGCASGRIEFHMENIGVKHIQAFDFVPEFVETAKRNASARNSNAKFFVGDMRELSCLENAHFDYAVYLNRMLCFVDDAGFDKSLREIRRTLKQGGLFLFDALDYNGRKWNELLSFFLKIAWGLQGAKIKPHFLPRVRNKDKRVDLKFWKTDQNLLYWFTKDELEYKLRQNGFKILDFAKEADIFTDPKDSIIFYVACEKC